MADDLEGRLVAIKYVRVRDGGPKLSVLDQLLLPHQSQYVDVKTVKDGFQVIRSMQVRGAPAIAIVAALSLLVELKTVQGFRGVGCLATWVKDSLEVLRQSRPTAVNLFDAAQKLEALVDREVASENASLQHIEDVLVRTIEQMLEDDIADNKAIGRLGAQWLNKHVGEKEQYTILTHCNTGSLATAGYGTALGIVRSLKASNWLKHVYCTETRPYNQGRLTSYELLVDKILPATMICDSMASALVRLKGVDAIIVGADRVVANGDTANKIGTYQLAIVAHFHGIPFIVAAPKTSIDLNTQTGDSIKIEERHRDELLIVKGGLVNESDPQAQVAFKDGKVQSSAIRLAPADMEVWNPAFDVTPASLISAIVTEDYVFEKEPGHSYFNLSSRKSNGI